MIRALVINGAAAPRSFAALALEAEGFLVLAAPACASLKPIVRLFRPDVLVVDGSPALVESCDIEALRLPVVLLKPAGPRMRRLSEYGRYPAAPVRAADVVRAVWRAVERSTAPAAVVGSAVRSLT